ncbi:peptidase M23 family protein [Wolbachia endosymbiont of Wuchereria bancrofti]|nr:peptidase M23 family protein [Wolbachia endosymbiont of Wuchereria bancrofti]
MQLNLVLPVFATVEGVIEYIGNKGGYGKHIKIKHKDGYLTCCAHVSGFSSDVKLGSRKSRDKLLLMLVALEL